MGKLKDLSASDVCRILSAHGFKEVRRKGSHIVRRHSTAAGELIVMCMRLKEYYNMPIISIEVATGRSTEHKRNLVQAVTNAVVEVLDIKPEWVTVLIDEIDQ